jgi:hypothetical protein
MNMKKIIYVFIFFSCHYLASQIYFDKIPPDKQLVPRDLTTNLGTISIEGEARTIGNDDLVYQNWGNNEPNNTPAPENVAEIINSSGNWNDADSGKLQSSYVEYDGLITSLGDFIYLGQYNGHSYFKNPLNLSWDQAKLAAENVGAYLSSHQTANENSVVASFDYFRGWIGLYQDLDDSNYTEPNGGWKWVVASNETYESFDSMTVKLYKNNNLINSFDNLLNYQNGVAPFNFQMNINSELSKYSVKIFTNKNGSQQQIGDVNDIVAGDIFVIQGQSNATALAYSGSSNSYLSDYIRVFSGGHRTSSGLLSDVQWHYGQGDGNEDSKGNTGQWGLVLAKKMVDQLEIPIAIINGADGGKPVSFFQAPSDYKSSTNSNYGRLYYRLNEMGLKDAVRAVLWSQGEADSFQNGLTTNAYKISFNSLKNSWLTDYKNIEKIYIFQTRDCDCGTVLSGRLKIKEAQRQLADEYENIYIMGTSGITVHSDNCHFPFSSGYESFGQRIFKPVMSHIYGNNYEEEIDPPHIVSASLTDTQTLKIETNQNLFLNTNNTNNLLSKIQSDFVLTDANGVTITSFNIENKSLVLGLSANPGANPKISFNGKYSGVENNITNSVGLEMVCFSYFSITGGSGDTGGNVSADQDKKPAIVFVENGNADPFNGMIYRSSVGGAARNGNGNDSTGENNYRFGNLGEWSVDLTVSEKSATQASVDFGNFRDNTHPLYQGQDVLTQEHGGMGALGWGSFSANAYNRASGTGSVAMGFHNIAGTNVADKGNFGRDENNGGQAVFGRASRATGPVSFASGYRNTASGTASVAMGNYNYATGDSSIAIGKNNYAEGASAVAIGFQSHAAGGGSVALGQENISWGTTNFTAGYQNTAGDTKSNKGTGGSATAMGSNTTASGRSSFTGNKNTSALNQASTALGLSTVSDNFGMLAIGVNNLSGLGDTTIDPENYDGYFYIDGNYTGATAGIAFVIGNGDLNSSNGLAGSNSSNAFMVKYDGSVTLAGDLALISDTRLKSNIISLGSTLAKLLQIDGKSYTMKSNERENKIGLLAQDVAKVLPELVKKSDDTYGTLSVNYLGLIPVLINAIKEQQKEIKLLKNRINAKI